MLLQGKGYMVRFASNDKRWPFWLDVKVSTLSLHESLVKLCLRSVGIVHVRALQDTYA